MALWGKNDVPGDRPKYANTADVLGISTAEAQADKKIAHPGWVKETRGTGPVVSINVTAAGTGYANGAAVTAATTHGSGFAGTARTNGAGGLTGINITSGGQYHQAPVLTVAGGTGATVVATVGGRAGRVHNETLVAMGSIVD